MKTKIILALILTFAFGGLISAQAQPVRQQQKIQVKKQKKFSSSKLNVKFVEMIEDSRCPKDVDCVWSGNARIKIEVKRDGSAAQIIELNTNINDKSARYDGLLIELISLTPEPANNIRINKNGYVATIAVSRLTR
jgi:hypothetical protein